ncbi:ribosome small subunit-dependent GTPase A [Bacillus marinisedimentorum]|uniref:ribosome small subunit-dependent GTPase A n=1 Tax=Bacillus marinisedimentorum TaxID=1821260 RepID=UPI0007E0701F|nr:ribosome small subunit-dependent GTPase A [Bacillus marinisedimentorum]
MAEGKIIKSLSGFYYVLNEDGITRCRGRGVFRKNKITPLVGDEVVFEAGEDTEGYIMEVKPRKNELVRPPISNVDQAILVFSAAEPDFSASLLDRFLVLIEANDIKPVIVITKMDLLSAGTKEEIERYAEDYRAAGYDVLLVSNLTGEGITKIKPFLKDRITVAAGQSGVGKSSLLNTLIPDLDLETSMISESLGRGKHTTRHVELIDYNGGLIADTPGFSSLDFQDIEAEDLTFYFPEMRERLNDCKFRGCIHINEPKCAVKRAVDEGEIPIYRYEHYKAFFNEIKDQKRRY